jgi:hypothetical protein
VRWDQVPGWYGESSKPKKKAKKKAAPKKKRAVKKKVPRKKKAAKKKRAKKKTERVDRWREGKLYQARDFRFYPEDHELLTPGDFAEGKHGLTLQDARAFVAEHHYLHKLGDRLRFVYGLYHKPSKRLVGVASYGSPPYTHVLPKWFPEYEDITQVGSELNRLILLDEVPANAEGWFIRESQKDLSERHQRAVVSFSDPVAGHVGTVYKATEAAYTGTSKKRKAWIYKSTGLPVTPNDIHKLKAGCPIHRPVYKREASRLAKRGLGDKAIKKAMRGRCGSGRSISGWEASIARFEEHGAPPYQEGTCLSEWRDLVLPMIAKQGPVPGKHRYLWDLPRPTEGLSKRAARKERRKAWEATRARHTVRYPCGVCQATTHKTWECPDFVIREDTPPWLLERLGQNPRNPHIRSTVAGRCGKPPRAVDLHYAGNAVLILDLDVVDAAGPEMWWESRCPFLAGFKQGNVQVQRKGVSWAQLPVHAESYSLRDLAARVGISLRDVEAMLIAEGRAWARSSRRTA